MAEEAVLIAKNAGSVLSRETYPTTIGSGTNITSAALSAEIIPRGYSAYSSTIARSPSGILINVRTECFAADCPRLTLNIYGDTNSDSVFNSSDCYSFVRRFAGAMRDKGLVNVIQVKANDGSTNVYSSAPPFDFSTLSCPTDFDRVVIGFSP